MVLEIMLSKSLTALIEKNNGSMEQALDDMNVRDEKTRQEIKEWYGWEEEESDAEYDEDYERSWGPRKDEED